MKLVFYDEGRSEKHLRDIAGIVRSQGEKLDRAYIELWADRFAVLGWWLQVRDAADKPTDSA